MNDDAVRTNTFTEEGRLPQVEYAIKNVSNAGTIVGLICDDGIVLLGINKGLIQKQKEKIYPITDFVYCGVSGIFGDAMRLKKYAQIVAQEYLEDFGVECPVNVISNRVGEKKQKFTQYGGSRPFGVSFLYVGVVKNEYVLFSTDPSGTVNRWRSMSFGENEDSINNGLRNDFPEDTIGMERGTKEIFKILQKVRECSRKEADYIEVLHYTKDGSRFLEKDEICNLIDIAIAEGKQ